MGEYYSMIQLLAPGVIGLTDAYFARMYTRPIAQGMLKDASEAEKIECSQHIEALRYRVSRENNIVNEKSSSFLHKHIPAKFEFCVLHDCTPFVSDSSVIKERHNVHAASRLEKVTTVLTLIDAIRKNSKTTSSSSPRATICSKTCRSCAAVTCTLET